MKNFEVYKKTLSISTVNFLFDLLVVAVIAGFCVGGFFIANNINDQGFIGVLIGLLIGIVFAILMKIFVSNRLKAAHIAMITEGVSTGTLPEKPFKAGMAKVKSRFLSITGFFFITGAIRGVFRQLGRLINKVATAIGGNTGDAVSSVINSGVEALIGYLCDCCLGWVFYREDQSTASAACEGAVIFFKHGKTLIKNIGRIAGLSLLFLILIGGSVFGILVLIFSQFPVMFNNFLLELTEIAVREGGTVPEALQNPTNLMLIICGIGAFIIWNIFHSVLVRPFILTGVLRNFIESGKQDIPSKADFAELSGRSTKFAKLYNKI